MDNEKSWFEKHREELIEDLCDLVRISSVSHKTDIPLMPYGESCRKALDCMLSKGRRDGFETYDYEGYCGSIVFPGEEADPDAKVIGVFGHLDVVEAGDGWSHDPFSPVVENGIVSGRGAADDKGSLLSAYYALKYLKSIGYKPKYSFLFYLGLNEEKEMEDIDYYLSRHKEPDFSIVTDSFFPVCIGEKGVMNVKISGEKRGEKILWFQSGISENAVPKKAEVRLKNCRKITCSGKSAHAAFPEGSENAMAKLADHLLKTKAMTGADLEILRAIKELFSGYDGEGLGIRHKDSLFGDVTAVGTMFSYDGSRLNISVNIRYGLETKKEEILERMEKRLEQYGLCIAGYTNRNPFYRDPAEDKLGIIDAINEIACRQLQISQDPYVMSGGTYAKKLQRAVGFGPDYPGRRKLLPEGCGGGHQPDEYVDVKDIEKAFFIYVEAFQAMDRASLKGENHKYCWRQPGESVHFLR